MKKNLLFLILVFLIACACSQVSRLSGRIPSDLTIAVAPNGGVLAEAIGIELFNRGYAIVDSSQMLNLMIRLNIEEFEISKPKNLEKLQSQEIDAVLIAKSVAGCDRKPQSAS
jgi:hypothetical protein